MEDLFRHSQLRVTETPIKFKRYLYSDIQWDDHLIGITGARGTGKTTLMLQYIHDHYATSPDALYVSLDDFYFSRNRPFDLAEEFYNSGGKHLFIDEVHKYPHWSVEIKNISDTFQSLKIVFSGSSAIELQKAEADLSRRVAMYHLHELSFREYIELAENIHFDPFSLLDIIARHPEISPDIVQKIKPIKHFKDYLETGAYPYFTEAKGKFRERTAATVNVIIENDLQMLENLNYRTVIKLRKLISILADSVPFKPNVAELSRKTEVSRDVLLRLLDLLQRAGLLRLVRQTGAPSSYLTKPEKIYLNNTALLYALTLSPVPEKGTIRETFFLNQMGLNHRVTVPKEGDFLVNDNYLFEVGGKNKSSSQITGKSESFIAKDDIEFGYKNIIPLWLMGFLY